jgi:hypothetical protein
MIHRDKTTEDKLYSHYLDTLDWLGRDDARSAASAMRNLHVLSRILSQWTLPNQSQLINDWLKSNDMTVLCSEVIERSRWVLDSSVGNFLQIVHLVDGFEDITSRPAELFADTGGDLIMPSMAELDDGIFTIAWADHLSNLVQFSAQLDSKLNLFISNVFHLRELIFCGYKFSMELHRSITTICYVASWRD